MTLVATIKCQHTLHTEPAIAVTLNMRASSIRVILTKSYLFFILSLMRYMNYLVSLVFLYIQMIHVANRLFVYFGSQMINTGFGELGRWRIGGLNSRIFAP
jgi:hypothetical protein